MLDANLQCAARRVEGLMTMKSFTATLQRHLFRHARRSMLLVLICAVLSGSLARANDPARLQVALHGHTKSIGALTFSPDGATLATSSADGTVRLWRVRDGAAQVVLHVRAGRHTSPEVFWSPDGRKLATYSRRSFEDFGETQIWDADTGHLRAALEGHRGNVINVEWSPDSRMLLAYVTSPFTISLWDTTTGQKLWDVEHTPAGLGGFFWSPDGARIVAMGYGSNARLLDARTGRILTKLPYGGCTNDWLCGDNDCEPFVFSADGRVFLKQ
ncbi:MAG TPA: hypothetical protein VE821_03400, partial [Pyrinomonadaceae bacterium]|nr:hypothetical protein [Pyrinomonadaceae bacterium]